MALRAKIFVSFCEKMQKNAGKVQKWALGAKSERIREFVDE